MKYLQQCYYIILVMLVACTKASDLDGEITITGRAKLVNNLYTQETTAFGKQLVYLRYSGTQDQFILSTNTDSTGYYSFTNTAPNKSYEVFTSFVVNNTPYLGVVSYSGSSTEGTLMIKPDSTKINFTIITVLDKANQPVNGAVLYRFINQNFFDSSLYVKAIDSVKLNQHFYHVYQRDLPGTQYFIAQVDLGNRRLSGRSQTTLETTGVKRIVIQVE